MKKTLYAILTGLGILAGGVFIARAAVNCGQVFPTSLNGYTSNCIIPSSWAQALEAKIGTTGSAVTSSLDYQINAIFTSYGSEQITSSSLSWLNYGTASSPSSTWLKPGNNLSELTNTSTARTNLGLGSAATLASSTWLKSASNLSDLISTSSARTNIGFSAGTNIAISGLGAISFSGVLPVANGGTATSTSPADGQYLGANSAQPTWKSFVAGNNISIATTTTSTIISAISSSTAAGSDQQIQYNNGGAFGATSTLTFTSSTETLAVPNINVRNNVTSTLFNGFALPYLVDAGPNATSGSYAGGSFLTYGLATSTFNLPVAGRIMVMASGLGDVGTVGDTVTVNLYINGSSIIQPQALNIAPASGEENFSFTYISTSTLPIGTSTVAIVLTNPGFTQTVSYKLLNFQVEYLGQ